MALRGGQRPIFIGNAHAASVTNPAPRKHTSSDSDWGEADDALFASIADNFEICSQIENIPLETRNFPTQAATGPPNQRFSRNGSGNSISTHAPTVRPAPHPAHNVRPAPRPAVLIRPPHLPAPPIIRPNQRFPPPSQNVSRPPIGSQMGMIRGAPAFLPTQNIDRTRGLSVNNAQSQRPLGVSALMSLRHNVPVAPPAQAALSSLPVQNAQAPVGSQFPGAFPTHFPCNGMQTQNGNTSSLHMEIERLKKELSTKSGETSMLRKRLEEKEHEIANQHREKLEVISNLRQREEEMENEMERVKKQYETDNKFKDLDIFKMSDQLHRMEMQKGAPESSSVAVSSRKRPTEHLDQHENGGFPTAWSFHGASAKKKSVKRSHAETSLCELPLYTMAAAVQTDPMHLPVATNDSPPEPVLEEHYAVAGKLSYSKRMAQISRLMNDLSDSRPEIDERHSTNMLFSPFPEFTPTSSLKFNGRKKYDPTEPSDTVLSREDVRKAVKRIWKLGSQELFPTHLLVTESLELFINSNQHTTSDNPSLRNTFLLGALVTAAGEHLRHYVSLLYNVCWFHNHVIRSASVYVLEEISNVNSRMTLTEYFLQVVRSASTATLDYLKSIEHNAKAALILLRKLLEYFPELHKLYLKKPSNDHGLDGSKLPKMADIPTATSEYIESEPISSFLTLQSHGRNRSKLTAGDWILYHITTGYGLGQAAQEQLMLRFVQFPEVLISASILDLMLHLMDPLQFKIYQLETMRLCCVVVVALVRSVHPATAEGELVAKRLSENDVILNYLATAEMEDLLIPVLQLFMASIPFQTFVTTWCTQHIDTCFLLRLYYNVFVVTTKNKRELLAGCSVHVLLIDLLLEVLMNEEDRICALVVSHNRHCVETLAWQLTELLHSYVSAIRFNRTHSADHTVPVSVQQFVSKSVMWLFAFKRKLKHRLWGKYLRYMEHFVCDIVIALHEERLYEYEEDFVEILKHLYAEYAKPKPGAVTENRRTRNQSRAKGP